MKKYMTLILTALLLLSCAVPAFAAEVNDKTEITVKAKAEYNIKGEYSANIENGSAVVKPDGNTTIIIENAPRGAVRLIVVPIPTAETVAWNWINTCFKNKATPIHAFDIYFTDASGNRINANGATVTLQCSHCKNVPAVYSLTTESVVAELKSDKNTFTANGSHYYVLAEKSSEPVGDGDHKVDIADNPGGDVEVSDDTPNTGDIVTIRPKPDNGKVVDKITVTDKDGNKIEVKDNGDGSYSFEQPDGDVTINVTFKDKTTDDKPQTGDDFHLWLWIIIVIVSAAGIGIMVFLWRKKKK